MAERPNSQARDKLRIAYEAADAAFREHAMLILISRSTDRRRTLEHGVGPPESPHGRGLGGVAPRGRLKGALRQMTPDEAIRLSVSGAAVP